jgi:hypothetical protein
MVARTHLVTLYAHAPYYPSYDFFFATELKRGKYKIWGEKGKKGCM